MLPKYLFCFATAALSVFATPTTPKSTKTTKTTAVATPTGTNNGGQFITQCVNVGLSVADCTDLLNIAGLNGNSISVGGGGGSGSGTTPVNNGAQFFTKCANLGISVLDCAEVANIAILNGNNIAIDLSFLTKLLKQLGVSGLLAGLIDLLTRTVNGLVLIPGGLL
ncbi:hypothetical protein KC340_g1892 [Hortaea werneckii]|nr:hypothetical protein KC342_g1810 [Hortaea werneckii]KAI7106168.1 hypothetical protein KC339_g3291 [Hortaea werneckii]KAI7244837.1 hypothetical protein KC365_g1049 [Hortaea werneckii]KAI7336010.1 hypothetical protein KC340_g1892 [Hortaea werneckii]KAI7404779.1 hypothetical protein KC328_g1791 [Hortaea werneckii]